MSNKDTETVRESFRATHILDESTDNIEGDGDALKDICGAHNTEISSETESSSISSSQDTHSTVKKQTTDKDKKPSSKVKSAIKVGDKVEIVDCPGHWSWCSPFTVEAIDGGMARLEMVSQGVEIDRLSKF